MLIRTNLFVTILVINAQYIYPGIDFLELDEFSLVDVDVDTAADASVYCDTKILAYVAEQ